MVKYVQLNAKGDEVANVIQHPDPNLSEWAGLRVIKVADDFRVSSRSLYDGRDFSDPVPVPDLKRVAAKAAFIALRDAGSVDAVRAAALDLFRYFDAQLETE